MSVSEKTKTEAPDNLHRLLSAHLDWYSITSLDSIEFEFHWPIESEIALGVDYAATRDGILRPHSALKLFQCGIVSNDLSACRLRSKDQAFIIVDDGYHAMLEDLAAVYLNDEITKILGWPAEESACYILLYWLCMKLALKNNFRSLRLAQLLCVAQGEAFKKISRTFNARHDAMLSQEPSLALLHNSKKFIQRHELGHCLVDHSQQVTEERAKDLDATFRRATERKFNGAETALADWLVLRKNKRFLYEMLADYCGWESIFVSQVLYEKSTPAAYFSLAAAAQCYLTALIRFTDAEYILDNLETRYGYYPGWRRVFRGLVSPVPVPAEQRLSDFYYLRMVLLQGIIERVFFESERQLNRGDADEGIKAYRAICLPPLEKIHKGYQLIASALNHLTLLRIDINSVVVYPDQIWDCLGVAPAPLARPT